jgi:hypothetical protein
MLWAHAWLSPESFRNWTLRSKLLGDRVISKETASIHNTVTTFTGGSTGGKCLHQGWGTFSCWKAALI